MEKVTYIVEMTFSRKDDRKKFDKLLNFMFRSFSIFEHKGSYSWLITTKEVKQCKTSSSRASRVPAVHI